MTQRVKLHVGCGRVYLRGWTNVDRPGTPTAAARPDLVERWGTEEPDYYGRHAAVTAATLAAGPSTEEGVCDAHGDFRRLPCGIAEAEEILARQVFEHLIHQHFAGAPAIKTLPVFAS